MYIYNTSGQFLGFRLLNLSSGFQFTSGVISGYRTIDGSTQSGCGGTFTEKGNGQYVFNMYSADTNGNDISFMFLCSGAIPVEKTIITTKGISGQIVSTSGLTFISSGSNVVVPVASLSGIQPISGTTVTVPIASISGAIANSGLFVSVPIATQSGLQALVNIATLSGIQPISGTTVTTPISSISGTTVVVNLATLSGIQPISGTTVSLPVSTLSGIQIQSGAYVQFPTVASLSGINAIVPVASLSGIQIQSGAYPQFPPIAVLSGLQALVNIATLSGVYSASGASVIAQSGVGAVISTAAISGAYTASGAYVLPAVTPASLSGTTVTVILSTLSGIQPISGTTVSVPVASLSGVVANSGLFVVAQSGMNTTTLSGTTYPASGAYATVPIASLSGVSVNATATISSGTVYLGSGQLQNVLLSSGGLEAIQVISGYNARQVLAIGLAVLAGNSSGMGTTSASFATVDGFTRVIGTLDGSGNRSNVSLSGS